VCSLQNRVPVAETDYKIGVFLIHFGGIDGLSPSIHRYFQRGTQMPNGILSPIERKSQIPHCMTSLEQPDRAAREWTGELRVQANAAKARNRKADEHDSGQECNDLRKSRQ